ncbi:hypothetical protein [Sorangium sp. So ce233]|uniref:hypothetical protein n=1 Tax=Sorangium sp. So ce233 TaxID=3133290 RepID=UPI003F5E04A6
MTGRRPAGGIDVLVITALQLELDAVLALGEGGERGWQEAWDPSGFRYHLREIPRDRRWRAARLRQRVHASGKHDVWSKLAHRSGATGSPSRRPIVS